MQVNIVKPFTFTHNDGSEERFVPGSYDLPEEVAKHWYVNAHSDKPEQRRARPGTPEFAQQQATGGHADAIDAAAMRAEIAQAEAEIRKKYQEQANTRQRARLDPEARKEVEGDDGDDDNNDDSSSSSGRASRRRLSRKADQQSETQDDDANRMQKAEGPNMGEQPAGQA